MSQGQRDHRQTWDLIPWILNGTASFADREAAEAHLNQCATCREELQFQRSVQTAIAAQPQVETEDGWAGLQARLEDAALEGPRRTPDSPATARFAFARHWWVGALAAMVVLEAWGIGALGMALWASKPLEKAPLYQTLAATQAPTDSATIRIVFVSTMRISALQQLLHATGLQVVGGPTEAGVWSLAPSGAASQASTDAEVGELRANPAVRFAEAVGSAQ